MSAFDHLFHRDPTTKIFKNINRSVDIITLNYSKGETDMVTLLFTNKDGITFDLAMPLLVMRFKMYSEEWNDIENYTKKDIKFWTSLIKNQYEQSSFKSDISFEHFRSNFFVNRLFENDNNCKILHRGIEISHKEFKTINPLSRQTNNINKIIFERLEEEYFVETEKHFVMFIWFTTA
jgi:hypothetical protein